MASQYAKCAAVGAATVLTAAPAALASESGAWNLNGFVEAIKKNFNQQAGDGGGQVTDSGVDIGTQIKDRVMARVPGTGTTSKVYRVTDPPKPVPGQVQGQYYCTKILLESREYFQPATAQQGQLIPDANGSYRIGNTGYHQNARSGTIIGQRALDANLTNIDCAQKAAQGKLEEVGASAKGVASNHGGYGFYDPEKDPNVTFFSNYYDRENLCNIRVNQRTNEKTVEADASNAIAMGIRRSGDRTAHARHQARCEAIHLGKASGSEGNPASRPGPGDPVYDAAYKKALEDIKRQQQMQEQPQ